MRIWLDGDDLLGELADTHHLRARAMKLSTRWTARGLISKRWHAAIAEEVEQMLAAGRMETMDEAGKDAAADDDEDVELPLSVGCRL
jgi:hypothetical protein